MRVASALSALLLGVAFAMPAGAQSNTPPKPVPDPKASSAKPAAPKPQAAKPAPPPKVDPALQAAAQKIAGPFTLSSADGARTCPVTLKPEPAAANFAATLDAGACASIPFTLQVMGWVPDPSGSIRFTGTDGRTVAEFTEGTGGTYEALREGDGVYFLSSPAAVTTVEVSAEEMIGDWDLARAAGSPALCRWTLTGDAQAGGGFQVKVAPGCNTALADFSPATWRVEGGNVVVNSSAGAPPLRFARQEDGGWAKTPERGRPLLLLRP
ncbi:AprI/Inh family metalloprotease inhibitor [Aquabacter sp. CN5-332]|uniref:protease inhibitor Inh/omp19 family protein n=1 Tax=Aquabacter sp. CN5-332 TaxID=3156608 RepID=UPI0032B5DC01